MRLQGRRLLTALLAIACWATYTATLDAATQLKNICRVKGQEENTLHGLGLVVGLKGTGDGGNFLPTIRALATSIELTGGKIGQGGASELKDAKNVALVTVTATVPKAGARQGDKLDCSVSSIGGAKSLAGGRLFLTPLQGPQVGNPQVYAFAQGALHLDDIKVPTTSRVHDGCRLEEDFFNVFTKDNKITLVLDRNLADFQVTQDIAELINSKFEIQSRDGILAKALDAVNIEVRIPQHELDDPVVFVSEVLSLRIAEIQTDARVVINQRAGSVVIGADVEIGPVVITHKNIVIETGDNLPADRFIPIDPGKTQTAKLKSLVEALQAVKLPTEDIIEIIKGLERNGKLHGVLIVE